MNELLLKAEVGICTCGAPATILCKRGIAPGKWTRGKKRCEECWKLELPPIPENVKDEGRRTLDLANTTDPL